MVSEPNPHLMIIVESSNVLILPLHSLSCNFSVTNTLSNTYSRFFKIPEFGSWKIPGFGSQKIAKKTGFGFGKIRVGNARSNLKNACACATHAYLWIVRNFLLGIIRVPTQFWIKFFRLFTGIFSDLTFPNDIPRSNTRTIVVNAMKVKLYRSCQKYQIKYFQNACQKIKSGKTFPFSILTT